MIEQEKPPEIYEPNLDKLVVGARVRFRMGERPASSPCPHCGHVSKPWDSELPLEGEFSIVAIIAPNCYARVCPECEQFTQKDTDDSLFPFVLYYPKNNINFCAAAAELTPIEDES